MPTFPFVFVSKTQVFSLPYDCSKHFDDEVVDVLKTKANSYPSYARNHKQNIFSFFLTSNDQYRKCT